MSPATRRGLRLALQLATLATFTTALIVHSGWAGLAVDLVGVVLAGLGVAMMRRAPTRHRRGRGNR